MDIVKGDLMRRYAAGGHPFKALLTAVISSLITTVPLPSAPAARQRDAGALARAMLTAVMSSLISTVPLRSQSPTHGGTPVLRKIDTVEASMFAVTRSGR